MMMTPECWQRVLHKGLDQASAILSFQQLKVFSYLTGCGTEQAGSEVYACAHCGYQLRVHRSCRDRHYPCCQYRTIQQWCDVRRADVLPVKRWGYAIKTIVMVKRK